VSEEERGGAGILYTKDEDGVELRPLFLTFRSSSLFLIGWERNGGEGPSISQ
jgi:hypothetical protein